MDTKNIFCGNSTQAAFVNIIYHKLMERKYVSYLEILAEYLNIDSKELARKSFTSYTGYNVLKKAFPKVRNELEKKERGCILQKRIGNTTAYLYTGQSDDPLHEERMVELRKTMEDYVAFCKASVGLFPTGWFASFFEKTQLLLDMKRQSKAGKLHMASSLGQNLTNLELLPVINQAITGQKCIRLHYHPFEEQVEIYTFHPQFLKEYNGRWFVFGKAEGNAYYPFTVALDRIQGMVEVLEDCAYCEASPGFYQQYFADIVGVSHMEGMHKEEVVIRTLSKYHHGLVLTKPFHPSQTETLSYEEERGYGEIRLEVEPNRELIGRILTFGQYLQVQSPVHLCEQIRAILMAQLANYTSTNR